MTEEQDDWLVEAQRRFREDSIPDDPLPVQPKTGNLPKLRVKFTLDQVKNFFKGLFG